jgi:hypothetical protein
MFRSGAVTVSKWSQERLYPRKKLLTIRYTKKHSAISTYVQSKALKSSTGSSRIMRISLVQISLLRISLLRFFKTFQNIWLVRFYGYLFH